MSLTQNTTDLDLRYYGTSLRWFSLRFSLESSICRSSYQCLSSVPGTNVDSERSCSTPTPESSMQSWRSCATGTEPGADLGTGLGVQKEHSMPAFGFSVLTPQRFNSWPLRNHWSPFSAPNRIQPGVKLVGISSWVLRQCELQLRLPRPPFRGRLWPTFLGRSGLPLKRQLAACWGLAFLSSK